MLARLLHKCRYVFAILAAVFAAALVWLWPQQPLWRSADISANAEVCSDDSVVTAAQCPVAVAGDYPDPIVVRWQATTGERLSRCELLCANPQAEKEVHVTSDGRYALVGEITQRDPTFGSIVAGNWYLHDAVFGKRLAGPFHSGAAIHPTGFSPDGKWFQTCLHWFTGASLNAVFSTMSGELVCEYPSRPGFKEEGLLSTDGKSLAVLYRSTKRPDDKSAPRRSVLSIIEVPGGKSISERTLPFEHSDNISPIEWDGRYLLLEKYDDFGTHGQTSCVQLDCSTDSITSIVGDPLFAVRTEKHYLIAYLRVGSQYVAHFSAAGRRKGSDWYFDINNWLYSNLGPRFTVMFQTHVSVYDRKSGNRTNLTTLPVPNGGYQLSQSGCLVIGLQKAGGIAVWDTAPGPRWPWTLAAGLSVLAVFWLLGRIRWRRSPRKVVEYALGTDTEPHPMN
jgi:hypothetical protein